MTLYVMFDETMNLPVIAASAHQGSSLLELISQSHQDILNYLQQYGFILFRGFSCDNEAYFSEAIARCGLGTRCDTSDYDLPRTVLRNDVYTSSDLPGHIPLPLHHEKPRSIDPPHHIYFCCVTPATQGGGTLFANAEMIWQDIPESIRTKIRDFGVVYRQFFHGQTMRYRWLKKLLGTNAVRSWHDYFATEDKAQIAQQLFNKNAQSQWINNGQDLVALTYLPGMLQHPVTRRPSWFNSAAYLNCYENFLYGGEKLPFYKSLANRYLIAKDLLPMVCHYGNGHKFSAAEIRAINQVVQKNTRVWHWQKGDFMIVDNFMMMHGKQAHQGPRLLYSCMTEMATARDSTKEK